jgi:hypothetical protein
MNFAVPEVWGSLKKNTHHAASRHRWRGLGATRRGKLQSLTVVYLNLIK